MTNGTEQKIATIRYAKEFKTWTPEERKIAMFYFFGVEAALCDKSTADEPKEVLDCVMDVLWTFPTAAQDLLGRDLYKRVAAILYPEELEEMERTFETGEPIEED